LRFAVEMAGMSRSEAAQREREWGKALNEAATVQSKEQEFSEPTLRFLELLRSAIASGKAHLAGPDGMPPHKPEAYGWRNSPPTAASSHGDGLIALGDRIGWVDGEDLYLDPEAAFAVAQRVGKECGDQLTIASGTLRKRFKQRKLLASVDEKRGTITIRRTLQGTQRQVLHFKISTLFPVEKPDKPDKSDNEGLVNDDCRVSQVGYSTSPTRNPTDGNLVESTDYKTNVRFVGFVGRNESFPNLIGRPPINGSARPDKTSDIEPDIQQPCLVCGSETFWRRGNHYVCERCHPGPAGAERMGLQRRKPE